MSDVYGQLEEGHNQVRDIVDKHHNASHRQHVQRVGEKDERPGHQVVKHVLGEVLAGALEGEGVDQLVEMVGELEHIEVVEILWNVQARVVFIVERIFGGTAECRMQEITIFLKKNLVEQCHTCNIDYESVDPFSEHDRFRGSQFAPLGKLAVWYDPLEDLCRRVLNRTLSYDQSNDGGEEECQSIRITLCAFWALFIQLVYVDHHSENIEEGPPRCHHNAGVEKYALVADQALKPSFVAFFVYKICMWLAFMYNETIFFELSSHV